MRSSTGNKAEKDFVVTHPVDPKDAAVVKAMRPIVIPMKGLGRGIEARERFDALMESVVPRDDVTFEEDMISGIPGLWVYPEKSRPDEAILHLHSGWFNFGSARVFRHLVGHIAARANAKVFIPDYRLAPEYPFPAAVDDALACYRGMSEKGYQRIAITGDSAGGNLALVLASCVACNAASYKSTLVGVAALSPVTDLTLSGETYETRADADPYFTRDQVATLLQAYLKDVDAKHPLASPLHGRMIGLPPIHIHVGDDEILLDDSRRYVESAKAAGADARLDIWMGMPHGFAGSVGTLIASTKVLDAVGIFLSQKLQA